MDSMSESDHKLVGRLVRQVVSQFENANPGKTLTAEEVKDAEKKAVEYVGGLKDMSVQNDAGKCSMPSSSVLKDAKLMSELNMALGFPAIQELMKYCLTVGSYPAGKVEELEARIDGLYANPNVGCAVVEYVNYDSGNGENRAANISLGLCDAHYDFGGELNKLFKRVKAGAGRTAADVNPEDHIKSKISVMFHVARILFNGMARDHKELVAEIAAGLGPEEKASILTGIIRVDASNTTLYISNRIKKRIGIIISL